MKVGTLIRLLEGCDPDLPVIVMQEHLFHEKVVQIESDVTEVAVSDGKYVVVIGQELLELGSGH